MESVSIYRDFPESISRLPLSFSENIPWYWAPALPFHVYGNIPTFQRPRYRWQGVKIQERDCRDDGRGGVRELAYSLVCKAAHKPPA